MLWNDYFYYDETSPSRLRWKIERYGGASGKVKLTSSGDVAGYLQKNGYWRLTFNKGQFLVHRIIIELFGNHLSTTDQIDHINRDRGDNTINNLRIVPNVINGRNQGLRCNNKTGVTGVRYRDMLLGGRVYSSFIATWRPIGGNEKVKSFSINKYGYDEAFRLACEYRAKMIDELNAQGAGYSETHGL